MADILVEVTRSGLVESRHYGHIAVVNIDGELLYYAGDPYIMTYTRSSAKPIQTLEVILSGTAGRFGFTQDEIAIMCASHYGEPYHRRTVQSIMDKIGLDKDKLKCGIIPPLDSDVALKIAYDGVQFDQLHHDCSGKHAGMLAVCVHKGYDIDGYKKLEHPLQQAIKAHINHVYDIDDEKMLIGVDGCDVPLFGMPLYNMALGFARYTTPERLNPEYRKPARLIFDAMNAYPEMIAGTDGFCTELISHTHGKLIGKLGAEGIYCIGLKDKGIGIALMIEDGDIVRPISTTAIKILEDLNLIDDDEAKALYKYKVRDNINTVGRVVGEVRGVFKLKSN
jgi:L-asparaginase II